MPRTLGGFSSFNMSRNSPPSRKTFLVIGGIAIAIWLGVLAFGWSQSGLPFNAPLTNLGLFGDMFGAINALFSALAMSGAIYAIILQAWQIQDQKQHDYDLLRREKLEIVVLKIEALCVTCFALGRAMFKAIIRDTKSDHVEFMAEMNATFIARNEIKALVMMYFPSHESCLVPPDPAVGLGVSLNRAIEANAVPWNSEVISSYSKESIDSVAAYVSQCSKCSAHAASNVEQLLASP